MVKDGKAERIRFFAEIIEATFRSEIRKREKYRCPCCRRPKRGRYLLEHLAIVHAKQEAVFQLLSKPLKQRIRRLQARKAKEEQIKRKSRTAKIKPKKRSSENKARDDARTRHGVLDPDTVRAGGSNITWATPKKARK